MSHPRMLYSFDGASIGYAGWRGKKYYISFGTKREVLTFQKDIQRSSKTCTYYVCNSECSKG